MAQIIPYEFNSKERQIRSQKKLGQSAFDDISRISFTKLGKERILIIIRERNNGRNAFP